MRDENDLIYNLLLTVPMATLGIGAPTVKKSKPLLREHNPEKCCVLRKALHVKRYGTGDLLVNVGVYIPENLSGDEKALWNCLQIPSNVKPNANGVHAISFRVSEICLNSWI